jgi:ABC-type transport system involved in multi-copper enzyme maturation permease subunit
MRLFTSRLDMLIRRTATWVLLVALAVIIAMVFISVGAFTDQAATTPASLMATMLVRFPGAYDQIVNFLLGLGGLFAVVFGASVAGSEWDWGTLKFAVTRGERRAAYMLLLFAAVALLIVFGVVIVFLVGVVAAYIGATIAGVPTDGITDSDALANLPNLLGRTWVAITAEAAVGFAIATIARSQLAGIGAGIALYFGGTFLQLLLPNVVKWLPFNAANAVVANTSSEQMAMMGMRMEQLEPNVALIVVALWLIGSLVVTAVYVERAEIAH